MNSETTDVRTAEDRIESELKHQFTYAIVADVEVTPDTGPAPQFSQTEMTVSLETDAGRPARIRVQNTLSPTVTGWYDGLRIVDTDISTPIAETDEDPITQCIDAVTPSEDGGNTFLDDFLSGDREELRRRSDAVHTLADRFDCDPSGVGIERRSENAANEEDDHSATPRPDADYRFRWIDAHEVIWELRSHVFDSICTEAGLLGTGPVVPGGAWPCGDAELITDVSPLSDRGVKAALWDVSGVAAGDFSRHQPGTAGDLTAQIGAAEYAITETTTIIGGTTTTQLSLFDHRPDDDLRALAAYAGKCIPREQPYLDDPAALTDVAAIAAEAGARLDAWHPADRSDLTPGTIVRLHCRITLPTGETDHHTHPGVITGVDADGTVHFAADPVNTITPAEGADHQWALALEPYAAPAKQATNTLTGPLNQWEVTTDNGTVEYLIEIMDCRTAVEIQPALFR